MPFTGIANPSQIRVMTEALDTHCRDCGIVDIHERDSVAAKIVALFFSGYNTVEALLEALDSGGLYQPPPSNGDHDSHV